MDGKLWCAQQHNRKQHFVHWECDFDHLPTLVKECVLGVWEVCKQTLYDF